MRAPRKKALLVGINYPGTSHALRGCVNDVQTMNKIITNHFGFTNAKDKRMLVDRSATTANILGRLEWLVHDSQPGDVLFFHFSGHGSQVIDSNYDDDDFEPDGLDEIICPVDLDWRTKIIRDDDLKRIFSIVPAGVNLTVVLDCCHSGGGTDAVNQFQPLGSAGKDFDPLGPEKSRELPMPADIANRGTGLNLQVRERKVQNGDVAASTGLLISGCQSQQTSADAFIARRYQGAATFFLSYVLKKHKYDITYELLIREMNGYLKRYKYNQRPELNGPQSLFLKKFLAPFV